MPTDLAAEQSYLDRAHEHLDAMEARVSGLIDRLELDARADVDAATARHQLQGYRAALQAGRGPLCFGRIDEETGDRHYIGRRHVEDGHGDPVVVDWRASVAIPFYRATFRDPLGLHLRRRFVLEGRQLVGLFDEDFEDPDSAHHASGVADPLLAELDRARTGEMRDIVATIQAEQDTVIRAPLDQLLIVQGGPGTGKTAVGLHRAALLLYDHRELLERDGVLVIGPNRLFLRYISQVLPSLGETSVVQTTLSGLSSLDVSMDEPEEVAGLKGDPRMAELVARAAWGRLVPLAEGLVARTSFGTVRLDAELVNRILFESAAERRTVSSSRERFRIEVVKHAQQWLLARRSEGLKVDEDVAAAVRGSGELRRALDRAWPAITAPALVRRLLTSRAFLAKHAAGLLSPDEQRLLLRRRTAEAWTAADVVLVDEAEAVLGGRPRRYGHVVVDEAQDHSPMAWRMISRRCSRFPSLTVLGDLAQATAPAAQSAWAEVIAHLGHPEGVQQTELEIGYRVPGQILDSPTASSPRRGPAWPRHGPCARPRRNRSSCASTRPSWRLRRWPSRPSWLAGTGRSP